MKEQKKFSYAKWGYIFAAPFLITYAIFMLYPILYTIFIGFTDLAGSKKPEILDDLFANYKFVLTDKVFWQDLKNTIILWTMNFIPQITLAFVLAAMFTNERRKIKGQGFFKVVFYMPNIITAATIAMLFNSLFAYQYGPVNEILKTLGIISADVDWPMNRTATRVVVAFIQFWMWYGYTMIVLISGILGISPELFEAADIDGANGVQKFFKITIPNLKTIILFTLVTSMIGGLNMFDIPYALFSTTGDRTNIMTTSSYIYEAGFGAGGKMYARASAASMVMFVIIAICAGIIFFALRDKDEIAARKIERQQEKLFKQAMKEKGGRF